MCVCVAVNAVCGDNYLWLIGLSKKQIQPGYGAALQRQIRKGRGLRRMPVLATLDKCVYWYSSTPAHELHVVNHTLASDAD